MARASIQQFSSTASSNADINGISTAVGWSPANVGSAMRTLMALLADAIIPQTVSLGSTSVTLTAAQASALFLTLGGTPGGVPTVSLPTNQPMFGLILNSVAGGYSAILTSGAGTTATIPNDGTWHIYSCDASGNTAIVSLNAAALILPNSVTLKGVDAGGFQRGMLEMDSGNNTTMFAGNGTWGFRIDNQAVTQQLFAVDPNGTVYLGAGQNANPITAGLGGWTFLANGEAIANCTNAAVPPLVLGTLSGTGLETFYSGTTQVGTITTSGGGVSYNSASDATLKLDDGLIGFEEARAILERLRPRWFRWKRSPDDQAEPGFFAQELHRVFRWAVTKGDRRKGRVWMSDNARLMPVVVATLQGALEENRALRARLEALEGRIA